MTISIEDILIRLTVAFFVGAAMGLERTIQRKSAGIKTHTVICIVSTMVTMVSMFGLPGSTQPARILANILVGVGFLCAGVIFSVVVNTKKYIKGLTTAAEVWGAACIGIPIGLGDFMLVAMALAILLLAIRIERIGMFFATLFNRKKT